MQAIENKLQDHVGQGKVCADKEDRRDGSRKGRKPGRKSTKVDMKMKLERSRQSARECRARKKIRYQYLEELVADRERAVKALRKELEVYKYCFKNLDEGVVPEKALELLKEGTSMESETSVKDEREGASSSSWE